MENYSLLMGAAAVMKMAVEMAAVSIEKPSGALPRSGSVPTDSCPPILASRWRRLGKVSWVFVEHNINNVAWNIRNYRYVGDVSTAELETLRRELEDLEERVRATKQLISDKEALIARSQEEAEGLKAQLKTDLAEIRDLHKQLVTGKDKDDEAEIAEVDRVRADALRAFEAFLP
ncbi:hypothetical protein QYE76_047481 [Lolium multiflorum]|uniref:Uncharacterized protein n=1 Tax=Lolium multiflorum TaxID=4521 RepID=A0AAD8TRZ0_LOLMU|nr:hypothetical protein QYE76_047481 [Lolium multiflorum]